jgi:hypothetical protein
MSCPKSSKVPWYPVQVGPVQTYITVSMLEQPVMHEIVECL